MDHALLSGLLTLGLFAGMMWMPRLGRRLGGKEAPVLSSPANAALFALLGLLLAFTFSGAASRFDSRRQLITEEANAIGTAWLRIDLLPEPAQPSLRELFRGYLDSRLTAYGLLPDIDAALAEIERAEALQARIWDEVVAAGKNGATTVAGSLSTAAVNEMFDIASVRTAAAMQHPPVIIFVLLFTLALACALLCGHGAETPTRSDTLQLAAFSVAVALCTYVIIDLEYPRMGWIRLDDWDEVLRALRKSMG